MLESTQWQIEILGGWGYSYKFIGKETGYSNSTISKVLKRAKIKVKNYRNGESTQSRKFAKSLIK
jgi:IS30 family transposase